MTDQSTLRETAFRLATVEERARGESREKK